MIDDGKNDDEIADELGVAEQMVGHQIENTARIEAACRAA